MTMKRDSRYLRRKEEVNIDFTKCKKLMSSNLPLLFANGQPRSLETISQPELEEFVPFMVQCSLGQEILKSPKRINNCPAPDWWPQGLPFKFPLIDQSDWINRLVMLKSLVCRCYTYYNCEFLLKFSSDLADIPPSQLRFEINDDNTTTIYDQNEGMLVKCRNENLNYDLHKNPRRYLSPAHVS
ncbi:nuclear respiratory factor 1-like [Macrosteles quadrilineatus]|uniref:nuclear respiratory factor 1-like n=1 Tax=Macrosteles quadrilineatus TaxID=74068 RepID=UPI0023E0A9DD|nr:nuclear respiratory factor 1-like [Macrosteles quadrilineatus]